MIKHSYIISAMYTSAGAILQHITPVLQWTIILFGTPMIALQSSMILLTISCSSWHLAPLSARLACDTSHLSSMTSFFLAQALAWSWSKLVISPNWLHMPLLCSKFSCLSCSLASFASVVHCCHSFSNSALTSSSQIRPSHS
jgi:hypothetical protein